MAKSKKNARPAVDGVDMDAETISRQPIGDARNAPLSNRKSKNPGDLDPSGISRQPEQRGEDAPAKKGASKG